MYQEESIVTKNGVTVYSYKNPGLHGFYISLFLRSGSMQESKPGISHFFEHAAIRNVSCMMENKLYSTLDRRGIEFNASTFSEMVQFYISGASVNFGLASEIIARVLAPIILKPDEVNAERDRIKAEIRESDDKSSLASFSNNIVYAGTTLANPITGTVGSVNKIYGKTLEEYRKSVMTTENIFFYVTGNFSDEDIDKLCSEIEKYQLENGKKTENIAPVCAFFGKREGKVYVKNADFTMLRFSFDMDMSKMSVPESDLLYDMLLGGYDSRFFIEMSEKRALFYDITGSSERYNNIGSLVFSFEVRGGTVYEAAETAISLLKEYKQIPPDADKMMKAGYVTNAYLLYDEPRELNFTFAYDNHVMSGGYKSIDQRADRYKSVTPERVRQVADLIFRPENLVLTIKGNKKKIDIAKLEEIIRKL